MLKIEFDVKTGHYGRHAESHDSDDLIVDMVGMTVACGLDILETCGKAHARAYVDLVRGSMDALENEWKEAVLQ